MAFLRAAKWVVLSSLFLVFLASFGCAGAQVKQGDRLRVVLTSNTWGYLVPTG